MTTSARHRRSLKKNRFSPTLLTRKEGLRFEVWKDLRDIAKRIRKNKIGDAALLPSSKDSVMILHGSQYLLRFVEESLPNGKTRGKLRVAWYGSFVLLPAYGKTKGSSVLPRGFGSNSHLPRSANATKASANDKTLNPSVKSIIKRAQKGEVL